MSANLEPNQQLQELRARVEDLNARVRSLDYIKVEGASTALSEAMLREVYSDVLLRIARGEFDTLQPGEGKYVGRAQKTALREYDRSYEVIRDSDGTYKLFIEPKSNLPDNTKRDINFPGSSFKVCKVGFRVDTDPFLPCAALVVNVTDYDDEKIEKLIREVHINNFFAKLAPQFFNHATIFYDQSAKKIHILAEHVMYDLFYVIHALVKHAGKPLLNRKKITFGKTAVQVWQLDLIQQLLQGVQVMHNSGHVHRDLKAENIMCAYDPKLKRMIAKIIDFGFAAQVGHEIEFVGTAGTAPPELFVAEARGDVTDLQRLPRRTARSVYAQTGDKQAAKEAEQDIEESVGWQVAVKWFTEGSKPVAPTSSGEHDVWSLGVTFCELLHLDATKLDPQESALHELLCKLLNPDPNARIKIDDAIALMDRVLMVVQQQDQEAAASLKAPIEFTQPLLEFKTVANLQEALDGIARVLMAKNFQFNEQDYKKAAGALGKYCATLSLYLKHDDDTIQNALRMIQVLVQTTTIPEEKTKEAKFNEALALLEKAVNDIWKMPDSGNDARVDEDAWMMHIERRLVMLIARDFAEIAKLNFEGKIEEAEHVYTHMQKYAISAAQQIEAHAQMPFKHRFTIAAS